MGFALCLHPGKTTRLVCIGPEEDRQTAGWRRQGLGRKNHTSYLKRSDESVGRLSDAPGRSVSFRGSREEGHGPRCGQRSSIGRNAARRWRCQISVMTTTERGPASSTQLATQMFRNVQHGNEGSACRGGGTRRDRRHRRGHRSLRRGFVHPTTSSSRSLVLGVLTIAATNLEVMARTNTGISGSVMVLMASIIVFCDYSYLPGSGARRSSLRLLRFRPSPRSRVDEDLVQLRVRGACHARRHRRVSARHVDWLDEPTRDPEPRRDLRIRRLPRAERGCSSAFAVAVVNHEAVLPCPEGCALPINAAAFPFAFLGLGLGWVYLNLGAAVVPLLVVPILIARSTFASYLELKAGQEQTIETLIHALEAKDRYTAGHAQRVATFSEYVGAEFAFGATPHGAAPLRGAHARHRQARRAQPAAQQARSAHRVGVRTGEAPRAGVGRAAAPHRLPRSGRGRHDHRGGHRGGGRIGPRRAGDHPRGRRLRRHDLHPGLPAGAQPGDRVRRAPRRRRHPVQRRSASRRSSPRSNGATSTTAPATRSTSTTGRWHRRRPAPVRPASATSSPRSRRRVSEAMGPAGRPPRRECVDRGSGSRSPTRGAGGHRSPSSVAPSRPASCIELKPPLRAALPDLLRLHGRPGPAGLDPGRRARPRDRRARRLPGPLGADVGRGAVGAVRRAPLRGHGRGPRVPRAHRGAWRAADPRQGPVRARRRRHRAAPDRRDRADGARAVLRRLGRTVGWPTSRSSPAPR